MKKKERKKKGKNENKLKKQKKDKKQKEKKNEKKKEKKKQTKREKKKQKKEQNEEQKRKKKTNPAENIAFDIDLTEFDAEYEIKISDSKIDVNTFGMIEYVENNRMGKWTEIEDNGIIKRVFKKSRLFAPSDFIVACCNETSNNRIEAFNLQNRRVVGSQPTMQKLFVWAVQEFDRTEHLWTTHLVNTKSMRLQDLKIQKKNEKAALMSRKMHETEFDFQQQLQNTSNDTMKQTIKEMYCTTIFEHVKIFSKELKETRRELPRIVHDLPND